MPMVFTLASHLRESLTTYLQNEAKAAEERASRQRDAEIAAEEEKLRQRRQRRLARRRELPRGPDRPGRGGDQGQ